MTARIPIERSCCFTGHRPKYFEFGTDETHPHCVTIKKIFLRQTIKYLIENGVTHFISGGALGVDTWAMEEVIDLRSEYPSITLECALPYPGMSERFSADDRARHTVCLANCDRVTNVSPEYDGRACLDRRNRYIVDHALSVVAVWNGNVCGTGRTVVYAEELGCDVYRYNPIHGIII